MILNREHIAQLREAGYSYHDIAQEAKLPTPMVMQYGQYGTAPERPVDVDFEAMMKVRKAKVEPPKETTEHTEQPQEKEEKEEKRGPGRPPKNEGQ